MRIGIQTWGSTGDIRPMIALAGGLSAAGHDVTVVATSVDDLDYRPLARSLGVACTMVPEHPRCDIRGLLLKFGGSRNELKLFRVLLAEILYPFVEEMHRAATALVARSDLVIGHFAVHPLKAAAAKARKPHVAVCYWPGLVPTAARAPFPLPSLGRTLNRLAWGVFNRILNRGMLRELALAWTREGLAPPASVIPGAWFSDSLNLLAASPLLWPAPPEWGDLYRVCGAFRPRPSPRPCRRRSTSSWRPAIRPCSCRSGRRNSWRPSATSRSCSRPRAWPASARSSTRICPSIRRGRATAACTSSGARRTGTSSRGAPPSCCTAARERRTPWRGRAGRRWWWAFRRNRPRGVPSSAGWAPRARR
jgi:hypothetical protein